MKNNPNQNTSKPKVCSKVKKKSKFRGQEDSDNQTFRGLAKPISFEGLPVLYIPTDRAGNFQASKDCKPQWGRDNHRGKQALLTSQILRRGLKFQSYF